MASVGIGVRLLKIFWGLVPWVFVAGIAFVVVTYGQKVETKKEELVEAKKSAMITAPAATKVISLVLEPRLLQDKINLPAEIQPMEDLVVRNEVGGQITQVLIKEGQMVAKGEIMMRLDDRDYRSGLRRVQANYKRAKAEHARILALAKKNFTAKSDLDSIEAQLKDLEAQLAGAQLSLARTKIEAPISGRLNMKYAKVGDFLDKGKPVAQILQTDQVKIKVGVPESDVAAVFDLTEATVIIEALGGLRVKGRKTFLSHQPSSLARLYDLELKMDNPEGRILPGMFARVELVKESYPGALAVPLYAIITQGEERFVYLVQDSKAVKRHVKIGAMEGWQVQVIDGLQPHDEVVIVGHRLLEDGQQVEVLKKVKDAKEIIES